MSEENELEDLLLQPTEPQHVQKREKKKLFYIPCIPKVYALFYNHPVYFLVLIPSMLNGAVSLSNQYFLGKIVNALSEPNAKEIINKQLWMAVGSMLVSIVTGFISSMSWIRIGSSISNKIKRILFKSLMENDVSFFDTHSIGDILTLLTEDAQSVESVFTSSKVQQLRQIGQLFSSLMIMLSANVYLTIVCIITYIVILVVSAFYRKRTSEYHRLMFKASGKATTIADEVLSDIRVVKAYNREEKDIKRIGAEFKEATKFDKRIHINMAVTFSFNYGLNWICIALIMNVGGYSAINGKLNVGTLLTFSRASLMLGLALRMLSGSLHREIDAIDAANRIFSLADEEPTVPSSGGMIPQYFRGDIEFQNVWFKYPSRDQMVLRDVSFKINHGEIAAFVGHSGSGKSTILQLLLRFYDVTEGRILLDNVDIREYDPHWLHRVIGVVQQDPKLFASSFAENIAFGVPNATEEQIIEAARIAYAKNFIESFPDGFNHIVGEKGDTISGGQRQRIAIARAVLKNPTILITDEATSALDAESESEVQAALDDVMKDRTSIIIAHRLVTIKNAKTIYVFDAGDLVEHGTHEELLDKHGAYFNLVQRQLM